MLKVRFETITLRVPVIDNSGEHDAKMDEEAYNRIHYALSEIEQLHAHPQSRIIAGAPVSATQRSGWRPAQVDKQVLAASIAGHRAPSLEEYSKAPPISQDDPVIDTTVRDSEMRSSGPEMTLEELRERPEKTRSPPRPRANSWRHGNG